MSLLALYPWWTPSHGPLAVELLDNRLCMPFGIISPALFGIEPYVSQVFFEWQDCQLYKADDGPGQEVDPRQ